MTFDTRKSFSDKAQLSKNPQTPEFLEKRDLLIAVEGVIGVGKTSLVRMLKDHWQVGAHYEVFEKNPFLTQGFYQDQKTHAFDTEVFFLLSRIRQHQSMLNQPGVQIVDYLFDKSWIFAQMNLSEEDRDLYKTLYQSFVPKTRKPDLVILLQADLETLMRRIYFRDREFERSLEPSYLEKLNNAYYEYFTQYSEAPVLRIPTTGSDFVNDPEDFKRICNHLEERIRGRIQLSFTGSNAKVSPEASYV
jgi:deoxyadenosine/deoxycytidine kinase